MSCQSAPDRGWGEVQSLTVVTRTGTGPMGTLVQETTVSGFFFLAFERFPLTSCLWDKKLQ
ncbi:unnamed protein product, partial [Staurois parvus]